MRFEIEHRSNNSLSLKKKSNNDDIDKIVQALKDARQPRSEFVE